MNIELHRLQERLYRGKANKRKRHIAFYIIDYIGFCRINH